MQFIFQFSIRSRLSEYREGNSFLKWLPLSGILYKINAIMWYDIILHHLLSTFYILGILN